MIRTLVFAFIVGLAPQITVGQEWPTKPLRFVIGSGPGGLMETVLSTIRPLEYRTPIDYSCFLAKAYVMP